MSPIIAYIEPHVDSYAINKSQNQPSDETQWKEMKQNIQQRRLRLNHHNKKKEKSLFWWNAWIFFSLSLW